MNMKKLTSIILFALLLCTTNLSFAQEPTLTKKQMYKDFDQLVKIIEDCNVQLPVRKAVTGYDNLAEIKKLRKGIDTVTTFDVFNKLLNRAIGLVLDGHTRQDFSFYPEFENLEGIDTVQIKKMREYYYSPENMQKIYMYNLLNYFSVPAIFYNYNYYMIGSNHIINRRNTNDTLDIHFMRLISYNGQDFCKYVEENSNYKDRWDYKLNKYLIPGYYNLPNKGILKVEQDGEIFEFNLADYTMALLDNTIHFIKIDSVPFKKNKERKDKKVEYFKKDSILYIYVRSMIEDSALYDKIKDAGRGKKINKVVIDVRGNGGGSDFVWHKILKAIVRDSLPYNIRLAYNDSKIMRNKLKDYDKYSNVERLKWLNNKKVRVLSNDTYLHPDSNSLNYNGKIYILKDDGTYSAAHSLVTYAEYLDQLVSVGYPTGRMVGFGVMPSLFQLKYSKFTFRLACTMDITNCTKSIDVYHDFPEIEVHQSLEEELLYPNSEYDTKSEEYLYKYDSMFKKVLELE